MNKEVERALNQELRRLQRIFQTGTELKILYLPGEIRINQIGKHLSGEVSGDFILIYEKNKEKAISIVYHEFVEYLILPLIQDYLDIINNQNRQITNLLVKKKEELIERLTCPLRK